MEINREYTEQQIIAEAKQLYLEYETPPTRGSSKSGPLYSAIRFEHNRWNNKYNDALADYKKYFPEGDPDLHYLGLDYLYNHFKEVHDLVMKEWIKTESTDIEDPIISTRKGIGEIEDQLLQ